MFHVTPAACQEVLAAAQRSQADGLALRVAAQPDAQGGLRYGMGFDEQREEDMRVHFHGLDVLIGAHSRRLLDDTVLDFTEVAPGQHEFIFMPVQELQGQGCGSKPATARGGCGSGGCGSCG